MILIWIIIGQWHTCSLFKLKYVSFFQQWVQSKTKESYLFRLRLCLKSFRPIALQPSHKGYEENPIQKQSTNNSSHLSYMLDQTMSFVMGKSKSIGYSLNGNGFHIRIKDEVCAVKLVFNCVFITFLYGILGQVCYLIVSILDLCRLSYFSSILELFYISLI